MGNTASSKTIRDIKSKLEDIEASSERKRKCETETERSDMCKRVKSSFLDVAKEYICPITKELMVEPVIAEDGEWYERDAITEYFKKNGTSPVTKKIIGKKLSPAPAKIRKTIECFVESGAIDEKSVDKYKQRKLLLQTKKRAENEDYPAMHLLGEWYQNGTNGLEKDEEEARRWREKIERHLSDTFELAKNGNLRAMYYYGMMNYKGEFGLKIERKISSGYIRKSADLGDPAAMAWIADRIIHHPNAGFELTPNKLHEFLIIAAASGSQLACYNLGMLYKNGERGMIRDKVDAKKWLNKVVNGTSHIKDLHQNRITKVQKYLTNLEEE